MCFFKPWLCPGIVGAEDTGIPVHLLSPQSNLHWEHVLSANPMSKVLSGLDSLLSFESVFLGVCENVWGSISNICYLFLLESAGNVRHPSAEALSQLDHLGCSTCGV